MKFYTIVPKCHIVLSLFLTMGRLKFSVHMRCNLHMLFEGAHCTVRTAHRTAHEPRAPCRVLSFVFSRNFQAGRDAMP